MYSYKPLETRLHAIGLNKSNLSTNLGISSRTIAKISKGEKIATNVLKKSQTSSVVRLMIFSQKYQIIISFKFLKMKRMLKSKVDFIMRHKLERHTILTTLKVENFLKTIQDSSLRQEQFFRLVKLFLLMMLLKQVITFAVSTTQLIKHQSHLMKILSSSIKIILSNILFFLRQSSQLRIFLHFI